MTNHWDSFWKTGTVSSIPFASGRSYSNTVAQYWIAFFKSQRNGNTILDVASGNLIVPVFAQITAKNENKNFEIIATDLADIDVTTVIQSNPHLKEHLTNIKQVLKSNTEELPFGDCSIDTITSMYGFEYSTVDKGLSSLFRVLKPNGRIKLLCHCHDSSLLLKNSRIKKCLLNIFNESNIFEKLHRLSNEMGDVGERKTLLRLTDDTQCEKARLELNNSMGTLESEYGEIIFSTGITDSINSFFSQLENSTIESRSLLISSEQQKIKHVFSRLTDLENAALDKKDIKQLLAKANTLGLKLVNSDHLRDDNRYILGMCFEFIKLSE